jgi:hypothetical protein
VIADDDVRVMVCCHARQRGTRPVAAPATARGRRE